MGAMAHNIICCASEPPVPTGQNHGKLHQQQRNKTRNSTVIGNPFAKSEPGGGPPAGTIIGGLEWRSKNQENRGPCWRQDPVMCVTFPLQSKALQLCKWHFFKLQLKIHPNSWCHVNFSQLSASNWVLNPCGGAICMGPVWGGEPVWRDIQLTKSTVSWKSFAHPTLHVVLRNLQFQPAKIMASCTNSKETKLETVLSLAIHLQRANLVVGSQQEPSLVALNEDQRTKRTEGRVGDKIQWCVWRFHSNLKHSSCASDISSNPSRDQIWDSNASHEDPCALGSKPLWNHLHWPSGGWSTCSAQGGTSKRALA